MNDENDLDKVEDGLEKKSSEIVAALGVSLRSE